MKKNQIIKTGAVIGMALMLTLGGCGQEQTNSQSSETTATDSTASEDISDAIEENDSAADLPASEGEENSSKDDAEDLLLNGMSQEQEAVEPMTEEDKARYHVTDEYDTYQPSTDSETLRVKQGIEEKRGVYYEIFVRSFADSDGDGIGDLNGITKKLDYLTELGIDGIWLMPINSSPSYHGYDVTDYYGINSDYGTKKDFEKLLKECHKRGIKVLMDLVVNHTSSEHPWFQKALSEPDSEERNYYRFVSPLDQADYQENAKSNWGSEVWREAKDVYYYAMFDSGMPELNFNNPKVREEIKNVAQYWLELGVDGFRLDAALHIYGNHEYEQMEDLDAANVQWWNEFACACEQVNPNVYLVGEVWKNDELMADYAKPLDSKFNFALASDLINAVNNGYSTSVSSRVDLAKTIEQMQQELKQVDENYLDATFITNHDQNRVIDQVLLNDRARLLACINLTLPGNPYIYYGEELGMHGAKPDEMIRTPFLWGKKSKENTSWETDTKNDGTASVKEQEGDETSMLSLYRTLIGLRKSSEALMKGDFVALESGNIHVLAYQRIFENEQVTCIHNLSSDKVEVELSQISEGEVIFSSRTITKQVEGRMELEPYQTVLISTNPS